MLSTLYIYNSFLSNNDSYCRMVICFLLYHDIYACMIIHTPVLYSHNDSHFCMTIYILHSRKSLRNLKYDDSHSHIVKFVISYDISSYNIRCDGSSGNCTLGYNSYVFILSYYESHSLYIFILSHLRSRTPIYKSYCSPITSRHFSSTHDY